VNFSRRNRLSIAAVSPHNRFFRTTIRDTHETNVLLDARAAILLQRKIAVQNEHLHERDRHNQVDANGKEKRRGKPFLRPIGLWCDAPENHQARAIPAPAS
jgi:hypothetical protein